MTESTRYVPPKVWRWEAESGGRFASINRPVAGPTHDRELPVGKHPLQLYSLGTPNGVKVTILLEELLAIGIEEAEYDAWLINIGQGDQFSSGFVDINPNSKIPGLLDRSTAPPTRVFESGAILLYLAEKFAAFVPTSGAERAECLSWLFWQMGATPFLGGGFGHFYAYRLCDRLTREGILHDAEDGVERFIGRSTSGPVLVEGDAARRLPRWPASTPRRRWRAST